MSFSAEVKDELSKNIASPRHCRLAELAAILHFCGSRHSDSCGNEFLQIQTENESVARKCFTLLEKTFNIKTSVQEKLTGKSGRTGTYTLVIKEKEQILKLLQAIKSVHAGHETCDLREPVSTLLIKSACCQRAFLRGAFLSSGSMSDPEKSYHLEVVCIKEAQAEQLKAVMAGFEVEARIVLRKKYHVVYLKEGASIVELLNIIGAHVSLMNLENLRILKEMRNVINRRVNCEAANITKTVNAASRQREDILLIRDKYGFENLQDSLRQMAEVRLEYPDISLKELGELLDPPVGKSGVNHRLRKLGELADRIRN